MWRNQRAIDAFEKSVSVQIYVYNSVLLSSLIFNYTVKIFLSIAHGFS